MVWGQCACGHVGWQKRLEVCGKCVREETRDNKDRQKRRHNRRAGPARAKKILWMFDRLNLGQQREVLATLKEKDPDGQGNEASIGRDEPGDG